MSTTVKTGWLKDKNGDKFAPKTLTSQVQTSDGTLIEDKIKADIDAVRAAVNPESAAVGQTIVVKSVDENGKPTAWEAEDFPECDVTSVNGQTGDVQTRLLVTITANEDGTYTSSHTSQEIYAASQAGAVVESTNINGARYQTYVCSESMVQFLRFGVTGREGNRTLNTYAYAIMGDKVIPATTKTPIPVAPAPMVGATASVAGTAGLVPKPAAGEQGKYLKGDGTWANIDCVQNPDTAAVGQTIVVKSVDENGKPTEWEAVEYQPKTHWYQQLVGYGYQPIAVNPQEAGYGMHRVATTSNDSGLTYIFNYDRIKSMSLGVLHLTVTMELGGRQQEIPWSHYSIVNKLQLIDSKNYKYSFQPKVGLEFYFITDVSTLTDEYKDMFSSVGVYLHVYEGVSPCPVSNVNLVLMTYNTLDDLYINPTIARTKDVIPTPSSAKVGQVITVKAIDENGKVTETVGSNLATDEDTMDLLSELGAVTPVTTSSGEVLTNNAGEIYTL